MTGLLLDTQIVLWAASAPDRLPDDLRAEIDGGAVPVLVSAVSIAEMAIKQSLGKLSLPFSPVELVSEFGFAALPLTWDHAAGLAELPDLHRDPFDRLLIATARAEELRLVTSDRTILSYPHVATVPVG